ncbi:carboxypeptidase regulatory-like domain-containing protein [Archangium violaceum]|uniref:carboxypeptidase regulatory-like domain-containing protein n=1 Tax=Archangium violaceum TaxID=83451 RepID=UPI0036D84744
MRRGRVIGVGAGLLVLLLWLVWRPGAAPESNARATAPSRRPQVERTQAAPSLWSSATPAEPRGTLSIQGQVVGPWRPVPGAIVVALAPVPRGLPTLPSPWRSWRDDGFMSPCELSRDVDLAAEFRGWQVPLARTTTDAQGQFRLDGLEGGAVALWAESGEGIGLRTEVAAGSVDVEVPLGPGKTFSGEVYDEQGRPIAGAIVTTLLRDVGHFVEASTNAEGRFLLGPLPWGSYDVLVSKEGLVPVQLSSYMLGRVTLQTPLRLSGQVVDARGAVPGVTVKVEGRTRVAPAVTDVKGQFRLEGLCPGRNVLTASLAERYVQQDVSLDPRGERESVVLLLENRLRVSGRVVDTSGQPIPNVLVSVLSEALRWGADVRTDARGGFLFDRFVLGTHKLVLLSERHERLEVLPRQFLESQELPPFTMKDREVHPPAVVGDSTLEVEWVDAVGRPVPQAPVHLSSKNGRPGVTVTTGMDGRAVFQGLLSGSYVVMPRAREQWLRYAPVAVELRSTETRRSAGPAPGGSPPRTRCQMGASPWGA